MLVAKPIAGIRGTIAEEPSMLVLLLSLLPALHSQACKSAVTRQEIRNLTPAQLGSFLAAVQGLRVQGGVDAYQKSTATHYNNVPQAHGVPAFFPWHRKYIRNFEVALQQIDPSVVLPYWDWTIDSQAPEKSVVFQDAYLGGNGRASDRCVVTGPFAGWNLTVPSRHCLRRQFNSGNAISSFYSAESIEAILNRSRTFDQLRTSIEGGPHGAVHVGIGGNSGEMSFMYSPNDPVFYLHHAFVDLLWNEWQMRNPTLANTYNGGSVSTTNTLVPFNVRVSSVLNTTSPDLCYTYPRWGTSLPTKGATLLRQADAPDAVSATSTTSVSAVDRRVRRKIRTPHPLPESYLRMNQLDVARVRSDEQFLARFVESLNAVAGFRPAADI